MSNEKEYEEQLEEILDDIVTLPSLPSSVVKLQGMVNDPDTSLKEIGQIISTDAAISLKTLRLVNSAQYGRGTEITSVEHACSMLGITVIRNLVLSAAVMDQMKAGTELFLNHSLATGMAAEMVAADSPTADINPDEAFVYGVLHDVGKIIFFEHMYEKYEEALEEAKDDAVTLIEAERKIIGADHAAMGARLAKHWRLPDSLAAAIGGHHDLAACPDPQYKPLAAMVAAADYICWSAGLGSGAGKRPEVPMDTWETLQLGAEDIPKIVDSFIEAVPNLDELINLANA